MDASAHHLQDQFEGVLFAQQQHPSDDVVGYVDQIVKNYTHDVGILLQVQHDYVLNDVDEVEKGDEQPMVEVAKLVLFEFDAAPRVVNSHQKY